MQYRQGQDRDQRQWDPDYTILKTKDKVHTEYRIDGLAYNLMRLVTEKGINWAEKRLKKLIYCYFPVVSINSTAYTQDFQFSNLYPLYASTPQKGRYLSQIGSLLGLVLSALDEFSNLRKIGKPFGSINPSNLSISHIPKLKNNNGLRNLVLTPNAYGTLIIQFNDALSLYHVKYVCDVIAKNKQEILISNNASGCESLHFSGSFAVPNVNKIKHKIYNN
jgi:hypothetical protein